MDRLKSSDEVFGARLLQEVEESEESLESLLTALSPPLHKQTGIPALNALWQNHPHAPKLSVSGRSLALLLHILSSLLRGPDGKAVVLIDILGRFSPGLLDFVDEGEEGDGNGNDKLRKSDLKHLHIFRPNAQNLESTLRSVEDYLVYGEHGSLGREFGGTILFGEVEGNGVKMEGMGKLYIQIGWRGWLRVEREEVVGFEGSMSAGEMLGDRERRADVVRERGWKGVSEAFGGGERGGGGAGVGGEFKWMG